MRKRYLSIGICQIKQGYDIEKNLMKGLAMIDEAALKGAEMVVLPEMFIAPYEPPSIQGAIYFTEMAIQGLKEKAARHGIYIVGGSLPYDAGDGMPFNRAMVFDPKGALIYSHDKIHLFDCSPPGGPRVKESEIIRPGYRLDTFSIPWGSRAAVIVCYDIRFTPITQILAKKGIKLLFVPAAFSLSTGKAHWEMLVRLRAVEIQGIVVGVQPAFNPELRYVPYGHSIVASPWGDVLFDGGAHEVVDVVRVDMRDVDKIRKMFPLLAHIRHDLYITNWRRDP
ncbi:MAG: carbon-nitrogen hydrolase family protein [Deltaproteobacteria bacterium]|nr:carbon-nitrogen hydrolase family protein [Deltaproteobacteria bacterium]